jgi:hypothetical protein
MKVTWTIDIETNDPNEAALKAFEIMQKKDTTATIFNVDGQEIDLLNDKEELEDNWERLPTMVKDAYFDDFLNDVLGISSEQSEFFFNKEGASTRLDIKFFNWMKENHSNIFSHVDTNVF